MHSLGEKNVFEEIFKWNEPSLADQTAVGKPDGESTRVPKCISRLMKLKTKLTSHTCDALCLANRSRSTRVDHLQLRRTAGISLPQRRLTKSAFCLLI